MFLVRTTPSVLAAGIRGPTFQRNIYCLENKPQPTTLLWRCTSRLCWMEEHSADVQHPPPPPQRGLISGELLPRLWSAGCKSGDQQIVDLDPSDFLTFYSPGNSNPSVQRKWKSRPVSVSSGKHGVFRVVQSPGTLTHPFTSARCPPSVAWPLALLLQTPPCSSHSDFNSAIIQI